MVAWVSEDVLAVMDCPLPVARRVRSALERDLPSVRLVTVPRGAAPRSSPRRRRFTSAYGVGVNAIVTKANAYVPVFGQEPDAALLGLFQGKSDKTIVPVHAGKVSELGGSARCLSWVVAAPWADELINAATD
jgi:hypothetical protein